jgi:hypothetical protein
MPVEDDHEVKVLMSCVDPSLKVPIAEEVKFPPGCRNAVAGVTAIDCSVVALTVAAADPRIDPKWGGLVAFTVIPPAAVPLTMPLLTVAAPEAPRTDHFTILERS